MGFWTAFGVNHNWVPRVSLVSMLSLATVGFLLMAPYLAYVFRFLAPESVVARIQRDGLKAAIGGDGKGPAVARQARTLTASDQLSDIAVNSISQKDKIIATACVDALRDLTIQYLSRKPQLSAEWYQLSPPILQSPDFASMAEGSLTDIERKRTWFEFKQLRQYQGIYNEALGTIRDINYVIAINTRLLSEQALACRDNEALGLAVKFFNTYLRATVNANDVRTAYTILNQYRMMAEAVLRAGDGATAVRMADHIKYYGHISYHKSLAFVTETVAYDLSALCEVAHDIATTEVEQDILGVFLEVDPLTSEGEVQETSLRGIRKAQVKLATFYLLRGAEPLARAVWEDMRNESAERLRSIRDEMLAVKSKDFWEISDRGGNFDYIEPERKEKLRTFFGWFREVSGELKSVSMDEGSVQRTEGSP
jgi:hypothetical protein